MTNIILNQSKANELIKIEKHRKDDRKWNYPNIGILKIPLISIDEKEEFILDIWKGKISLIYKYQTRFCKTIILVRLDIGGSPHRNPDGEEISSNHIHVYREDYNIKDVLQTLQHFLKYCNVTKPPSITQNSIQGELFNDK